MKTGRSLMDLAAELTRQADSKKDYVADTRALSVRPEQDGSIVLNGVNGGMPLRDTAHEQLGATLQIPKPYYDRLRTQAPDLLAKNVNHWLTTQPAKKLVRTLDGGVRAILSDRYRPLDNLDLAEAVLPKLMQLEAAVVSSEVTERRFYLKAITPRIQGEVKKGDVVQAGLVVSNSEIGQGSLKVEEMSYRLVCLNGAIHAHAVRRAHLGRNSGYDGADLIENSREFFRDETRLADDRAFFLKVQDAVTGVLSQHQFDKLLLTMRGATEQRLEDPVKVGELVGKRFGVNDGERKSILQHLVTGGDLSTYGLTQAITRASQEVDSYDRASELEALGGDVLLLPAATWK